MHTYSSFATQPRSITPQFGPAVNGPALLMLSMVAMEAEVLASQRGQWGWPQDSYHGAGQQGSALMQLATSMGLMPFNLLLASMPGGPQEARTCPWSHGGDEDNASQSPLPGFFLGFDGLPQFDRPALPQRDTDDPFVPYGRQWNAAGPPQPSVGHPPVLPESGSTIPAANTPEAVDPNQQFQATIAKNWSKWTNGTDTLSKERLNSLVQDPAIHGDDAAALGVVAANFDKLKNTNGLTQGDLCKDHHGVGFGQARDAINSRSHQLFTGDVDYKALKQGTGTGDCWFVSALDDKLKNDPDAVKKMIHDNGDGTYKVTLPGQTSETVQTLTDTQSILRAHSGANGEWGGVIDQALAQKHPQAGDTDGHGVEMVTGHEAKSHLHDQESVDSLGTQLDAAFNHGQSKVVTGGTYVRDYDNGLAHGHAYSVQGYDAKTQTVTLRNPWGDHDKGVPKPPLAKSMGDGQFTMSLADYSREFQETSVEGDQPASNDVGMMAKATATVTEWWHKMVA